MPLLEFLFWDFRTAPQTSLALSAPSVGQLSFRPGACAVQPSEYEEQLRSRSEACCPVRYPATIEKIDYDKERVLVHYRQWSRRHNEWFHWSSPYLRPLERVSLRRQGLNPTQTQPVFVPGSKVLACWTDCRFYPAKILKVNKDVYRVIKNQPPPILSIELDHNPFKCPAPGCSKSFRKASLLHYHIKYYHSDQLDAGGEPEASSKKADIQTSSCQRNNREQSIMGTGWRRAQRFLSEPDLLISGHMFGLSCVKENYSEINASKISHTSHLLAQTHTLHQVLSGLQLKISLLHSSSHPDLQLWRSTWRQEEALKLTSSQKDEPPICYVSSEHCYQKPEASWETAEEKLMMGDAKEKCRLNLLEHVEVLHHQISARMDLIERELDGNTQIRDRF
ncbi:hypothetical protein GOODEAATRI_013821 [Goodea atripinnis]|uniref:C2H2-type domain-containing protein n=1 Tax=Goodea atripinnis TaxID=208336 RepID=A0ABV0PNC7_9TELE